MNSQQPVNDSPQPIPLDGQNVPLVGIDTGGTFTDVVALIRGRIRQCKVLSTPDDPSGAMVEGLRRLGLADRQIRLVHGTTVGTNAVLEGKGARVAYITSQGFADVLTLGRQNRREVYRLEQPAEKEPVPRALCFEVSTRCDARGGMLARADNDELQNLAREIDELGVEAVAINLLFAWQCPEEERRIADAMPKRVFISLASQVLPEIREFERGMATWLNASVGPVMTRYLARLQEQVPRATVAVMQSSGNTIAASLAADQAVRLLLSGPAGGIAAARLISAVTGIDKMLTLDMGGTSTDVALFNGAIPLTQESRIADWPLSVTTVDIHTIGAGGGSIARMDSGGGLLVGPESAGASPGPACYGQGGDDVTVTDANVVLGRIPHGTQLGGYLPLDVEAAKQAVDGLAKTMHGSQMQAAEGVIRIANEHMARALRLISVERGHDPSNYALTCFGGAGGLHACELAELLAIETIVLPAMGGVLSAYGMLASEPGRDLSTAMLKPLFSVSSDLAQQHFESLENQAQLQLEVEGVSDARHERLVELRYTGQSATIVLPVTEWVPAELESAFHSAHESLSGHQLDIPVEVVNLRVRSRGVAPLRQLAAAEPNSSGEPVKTVYNTRLKRMVGIVSREAIMPDTEMAGPLIVTESAATTWVNTGWKLQADHWGNLILTRQAQAEQDE